MMHQPAYYGDFQPPALGSISNVTNIQQVEITIPATATTATATISSVDMTRSVIFWGGFTTTHPSGFGREILPRVELTNSTTVTASRRNLSSVYSVTVRATVVEFNGGMIRSVQYGTISLAPVSTPPPANPDGGLEAWATISAVDTATTAVFWLGSTTTSTAISPSVVCGGVSLLDATTVAAYRTSTGNATLTVGFVVVEFHPLVIASVQNRSLTLTSANTSDTDTITSVNTGRSLVSFTGIKSAASAWADTLYHAQLTASTTVTLTRSGTSTSSRTIYYGVVEFASDVVNTVQRGNTSLTSSPVDTTIASVSTTKSVCQRTGQLTAGTAPNNMFASAKLLNATTIRHEKSATATSSDNGWEVIEFI